MGDLVIKILFIYSGILTSVIAYSDTLYNYNKKVKFFSIKIGFIFTLYILLECIVLFFLGQKWITFVSVFILTLISYFTLPDLFKKTKIPDVAIHLLYLWSFLVYWILLNLITEETKIFSSHDTGYTFLLSIVLLLIPSIIIVLRPESFDE
jgi:hypothetical protein